MTVTEASSPAAVTPKRDYIYDTKEEAKQAFKELLKEKVWRSFLGGFFPRTFKLIIVRFLLTSKYMRQLPFLISYTVRFKDGIDCLKISYGNSCADLECEATFSQMGIVFCPARHVKRLFHYCENCFGQSRTRNDSSTNGRSVSSNP